RAAGVPGRPGARRPRTARRAASSAVVPEFELEPELLGPQERDYLLELVLGGRLHPDLLALDRGLRLLELLVLERLDDRLGLLLWDALGELSHGVVEFLQIGARGDVERRKTSHGAGIYRRRGDVGMWGRRPPTPLRPHFPTPFVVRRGSSPAPGLSRRDAAEPAPFP